jgi:hypothetical protein
MNRRATPRSVRRWRFAARAGSALAGVCVIGTGWAAFAPEAAAVSAIQAGYWSSLPAAPQVPSGGFEVGSNPSGPHAVAAIRFTLADGEAVQTLTLKVAQAQPQNQVAIKACPVAQRSASWVPPSGGGPGTLSDAPAFDCSGGVVTGTLSPDGTTMSFDLSLVHFEDSTVDIVLSPNLVDAPVGGVPGVPSQSDATFDASFQPVTAEQIAVVSAPEAAAPPPSSTGSSAAGSPAVAPAPAPAAAPPVNLPPATTNDTAGSAPVVAAPSTQPTNAAVSAPALVTKKRNLRLLFGIGMLSSDLLFVMLWLQHRMPTDERAPLSIYDPPPLAS